MPVAVQFTVIAVVMATVRIALVPAMVHDTVRRDRSPVTDPVAGVAAAAATAPVPGASGARRTSVRTRVGRVGASLAAWSEPRTLLIGVVIFAAAFSEGAANDWLSIAVVDGFEQTEAVGGLVFGTFVAAMTVMRLAGTRLIDRFGRVPVLRASGGVAIVGLLLFGFAPSLGLAGLGVVLWGFGAALVVPIGIAAASDDPEQAASRVSVVSAFMSMSSLAAPPSSGSPPSSSAPATRWS
ncbi:MFS transporter [Paraoerskovia sediminicola]|uniref:MFS transporter n=1 Tax=Paraoerskovia sediminicola TaxID=1138587 RepID=UPI002573AE9F|nr:MFS transporter [Paraoerskovia sediminicola]